MKKVESLQAALDPAAIYEKSKVYIKRGLTAKAAGDLDQYQLWASLALELLGKSCLARIHPSLIADPLHQASMFASAGINVGTDIKTILSKTVFERLHSLSPKFDNRTKKFCDDMALRRNAELHSGEVPFKPMLIDSWEGRYWRIIQHVLEMKNLTLEEWLGVSDALAPKELIAQAHAAIVAATEVKVADAKEGFYALNKKNRQDKLSGIAGKTAFHFRDLFSTLADAEWDVECPACEAVAFMAGTLYEEVVSDHYDHENPWEEEVVKYYSGDELICVVCDLHLNSRDEIEAASLNPDYDETDTRERSFEDEYGND